MKFLVFCAAIILCLIYLEIPGQSQPIAGSVKIIDGDTIKIGSEKIRLMGFDTPEMDARCTREKRLALKARDRLTVLIGRGELTINRHGEDRWGRTLAYVRSQGQDVGTVLIKEKLARPYEGGKRQGWCSGSALS
ncbi:MAG: thermonuclease family protein [Stappiaceae bacterium]